MEALVAGLLSDFENGKMTRRQLVQSLAMVAMGVPVARALPATPVVRPIVAPSPWKTVWLDHISYQVSDYKRSVDFYSSLMGWMVKNDTGSQATLDINGIGGIIIRNGRRAGGASASGGATQQSVGATTPPATRPDSAAGRGGGRQGDPRPPITGVINHISWGIDPWDTEMVRSELLKRGLSPTEDTGGREPIATSKFKSFHVRDPDGWDLQISNQTKANHDD